MAIKFSNSNMVDYVKISPYKNVDRIDDKGVQHAVEKITWHHTAGVVSVETLGSIMSRPGRNMSATYGIGSDTRVGRYLDEKDRPWTSSSRDNDFKAVTIEISNSSTGGEWPISDKVMQKAIDLTVDICKRNGIKKLTYTGDPKGNFTFHKMFSSSLCPGPYIEKRANEIVAKINTLLNANTNNVTPTPNTSNTTASTTTTSSNIIKGDLVKIAADATYYTGSSIPSWVKEEKWYVSSISGNRAVLGLNEAMNRNIQSPVNVKYLSRVNIKKAYTITLNSTDIIYATPGGKTKGNVGTNGIYTITEEQTVNGIVYGKLKSGIGWVIVKKTITQNKPTTTTVSTEIKKGDKVKVLNPIIYGTSKKFVVYVSSYTVLEVKGNRVVISSDGKNVTAAIDKKNLKKI